MADLTDLQKRLPDYFKALAMPWHLAAGFIGQFVDDDERPMGLPTHHARPLFLIAQAQEKEITALRSQVEALTKEREAKLEQQAAILADNPQNFKCSHAFFPVGFEDGRWYCGECWAEAEEKRANFAEDRVVELMARALSPSDRWVDKIRFTDDGAVDKPDTRQTCTCRGTCGGKEGLGAGWKCALEPAAPSEDAGTTKEKP